MTPPRPHRPASPSTQRSPTQRRGSLDWPTAMQTQVPAAHARDAPGPEPSQLVVAPCWSALEPPLSRLQGGSVPPALPGPGMHGSLSAAGLAAGSV